MRDQMLTSEKNNPARNMEMLRAAIVRRRLDQEMQDLLDDPTWTISNETAGEAFTNLSIYASKLCFGVPHDAPNFGWPCHLGQPVPGFANKIAVGLPLMPAPEVSLRLLGDWHCRTGTRWEIYRFGAEAFEVLTAIEEDFRLIRCQFRGSKSEFERVAIMLMLFEGQSL